MREVDPERRARIQTVRILRRLSAAAGYKRLDKILKGQLDTVVTHLNARLWDSA